MRTRWKSWVKLQDCRRSRGLASCLKSLSPCSSTGHCITPGYDNYELFLITIAVPSRQSCGLLDARGELASVPTSSCLWACRESVNSAVMVLSSPTTVSHLCIVPGTIGSFRCLVPKPTMRLKRNLSSTTRIPVPHNAQGEDQTRRVKLVHIKSSDCVELLERVKLEQHFSRQTT